MKICLWNVRGACRKDFFPAVWSIIEEQHPHVFVLFETQSDDYRAKEVMFQLKFNDYRVIPPNDKRGGIWLLWKYEVYLVLFTAETSHFHVLFHFKNIQQEVLVTGMHAPSVPGMRHQLWRNQSRDFTNFVDAAGLIDLGFSGCPFTWTNARDGIEMIKERLDRALASPKLLDLFPQTKLLLALSPLDVKKCGWNTLLLDLNDIFRKERLIWAQIAGLNWRKYGDYNTKYFHLLAKIKKSRGKILALKNSNGDWITKLEDLKNLATGFYENLFATTMDFSSLKSITLNHSTLSDANSNRLLEPITIEEVKANLFQMDPIKSPGPDGIQPIFFQKFWADLGGVWLISVLIVLPPIPFLLRLIVRT
ncbi:uncharacterized protein [Spinacia oleracea]|uniref:Endonuclease/exonuclease/phosphatase domain-containing protein n=1 Tax=Spinacia oleracea TaxID=3562 RepID=A0ABM3R3C3_SPIOL|nr:uncharacterized protein LOC130465402 [Spinacia oleracea]